jgi:AP-3 complex subunit beta
LAIKKGASDLSPIVRKAAALACVKCVTLDANTRPQVEEYLAKLLADQQYYVAGAAVQAFMEICPEKLDMIHPVYRKLCKMVVDMDEWGQLAILRLMTTYARKSFPRRTKRVKRAATREQKAQDFYEDLEPKEEQEQDFEDIEVLDPDLELLLRSVQPLLQSRNSAVIVSVARLYLYLSPTEHLPNAIGPLIALLRSPKDVQQVALYNIVQVCLVTPMHFLPYIRHFLIRTSEAPQSWRLKLEVLTLLFPYCEKSMQDLILAELEHFSKGHNADLVRESVRAIGRCSQASDAKTSRRCLSLLLKQIHSADSVLVGEAMEVVRHMIQRSPDEHRKTVVRLAKNLDSLTSPAARASIIWLVGEFAGTDPEKNIAADVLRILVRNYADETDEVRAQIVLLAAKVYLHDLNAKNVKTKALDALKSPTEEKLESQVLSPPLEDGGFGEHRSEEEDSATHAQPQEDTITLLYQHTMLLARYTPSYDLRDRARVYRALLALPTSTELASLLLLAPKPVPQAPSPSESHKGYTLGSASLVVGNAAGVNGLRGYEAIPDWVAEGDEPDGKLRDSGGVEKDAYYQPQKTVSAGQMLDDALEADPGFKSNGRKVKTLDDWLDDEDEEESESESGSGSEESEEESEYETDEDEEAESGEEESESEDDEKAGLVR